MGTVEGEVRWAGLGSTQVSLGKGTMVSSHPRPSPASCLLCVVADVSLRSHAAGSRTNRPQQPLLVAPQCWTQLLFALLSAIAGCDAETCVCASTCGLP